MDNEIQWEDGAVCYANNRQWHFNDSSKPYTLSSNNYLETYTGVLAFDDFQLNHIRTGDYIPTSELDTEQKYNDVVEVFELVGQRTPDQCCKRQLTYSQVMAIGKLKRVMDERDSSKGQTLGDKDYMDIADAKYRLGQIADEDIKRKIEEYATLFDNRMTELELAVENFVQGSGKRADGFKGDYESHPEINHCDIDGSGLSPTRCSNKPVVAVVMLDLTERMEQGIKTYGEALRPHNGRDALQDDYEEALDLACYLKQAMIELYENK